MKQLVKLMIYVDFELSEVMESFFIPRKGEYLLLKNGTSYLIQDPIHNIIEEDQHIVQIYI